MVRYRPPEGSAVRARELRSNPTDAEKAVWNLLRENFPDAHFRRQVPLRWYFGDFVSHRAKLVIEIDGGQHGGPDDHRRTEQIEAEGYRVIRFWNSKVLGNPDGVALAIAVALREGHPTQTLPIKGRA